MISSKKHGSKQNKQLEAQYVEGVKKDLVRMMDIAPLKLKKNKSVKGGKTSKMGVPKLKKLNTSKSNVFSRAGSIMSPARRGRTSSPRKSTKFPKLQKIKTKKAMGSFRSSLQSKSDFLSLEQSMLRIGTHESPKIYKRKAPRNQHQNIPSVDIKIQPLPVLENNSV